MHTVIMIVIWCFFFLYLRREKMLSFQRYLQSPCQRSSSQSKVCCLLALTDCNSVVVHNLGISLHHCSLIVSFVSFSVLLVISREKAVEEPCRQRDAGSLDDHPVIICVAFISTDQFAPQHFYRVTTVVGNVAKIKADTSAYDGLHSGYHRDRVLQQLLH